ncbi:uncharacterized protein B0H18DRAFT_970634 [Fomitopsis serialis]|uniref:uncharacterized protein n=1 Tax=Fomitopsis serialis TaxID=139415 RepID=UPI00200823AC|nr:uncharacterized protein B0H18DRAFT_970634 [Neoantrodia serialis]KAH9937443.1 hypothetical protein B0H18DRAFT_970634 [Neoantrodia serialis]
MEHGVSGQTWSDYIVYPDTIPLARAFSRSTVTSRLPPRTLHPAMTATATYRDTHSVETQKQRYSRELAEYTSRQWDVARQAMNSEKAKDASRRTSPPKDKSPRSSQGIQSIDYASRSFSGGNHEGRAIAAGSV